MKWWWVALIVLILGLLITAVVFSILSYLKDHEHDNEQTTAVVTTPNTISLDVDENKKKNNTNHSETDTTTTTTTLKHNNDKHEKLEVIIKGSISLGIPKKKKNKKKKNNNDKDSNDDDDEYPEEQIIYSNIYAGKMKLDVYLRETKNDKVICADKINIHIDAKRELVTSSTDMLMFDIRGGNLIMTLAQKQVACGFFTLWAPKR